MRKISCVILSFILMFSVGSVNVLAMEDTDEVSFYEGGKVNSEGEGALQQDTGNVQEEEAVIDEGSEEVGQEDETTSTVLKESEDDSLEEIQESDEGTDEVEFLDEEPNSTGDLEWEKIELPSMEYDDRYSLGELTEISESDEEYEIYDIISDPESYQVVSGKKTDTKDEVITQVNDSLDIIATGVGSADIYLVPVGQDDTDDSVDNPGFTDDEEQVNSENLTEDPAPVENGLKVSVTVEKATLTLMFLTGQSNMEGQCSSSTGYEVNASVACEEGTVYSTYIPTSGISDNITGIKFTEDCGVYAENAGDFVAESLRSDTSISGTKLDYPLDSLTTNGKGKTGPDSGLAYEWNQLTGDKVWVINTAWSGTSIGNWVPGKVYYERSVTVWNYVEKVYQAEIEAKHFKEGKNLVFWLQGETSPDCTKSAEDYMSDFTTMTSAMEKELNFDAFGIIMVRASTGSYTNEDEWKMTGPRIAQYIAGGSGGLSDVYVVSNANEQWVTDSGVESYFKTAYPGGSLDYPMHNSSKSALPDTVNAVHGDIHYSQIGHNENGITAAEGMYHALKGDGVPTEIQWKNEDGKAVSSLSLKISGNTAVLVPVINPVYTAKKVSYSVSGSAISFDSSTGIVTAKDKGTSDLTATYNGNMIPPKVSVTVDTSTDLSSVAGTNYTGIYHDQSTDTWWYLVNGVIQTQYEGVEQNEYGWWYIKDGKVDFSANTVAENKYGWWYIKNGKVDFSYTGFAENQYGWWYIEGGKVIFSTNSVIEDTKKTIDGKDSWWYVVGGQVQTGFTGLGNYCNNYGWWYIKNGKVDFSVNTVAENNYGWWYVTGGKVQFGFSGVGNYGNDYGWWYIKEGKVDFSANTVAQNNYGWWYVTGGKVQFGYTGVGNYSNSYGWWYIKDGKVDFSANTVAQNNYGWWYVTGGKVQFGYTGVGNYSNNYGWWYIKDGKVDFSANTVAQNNYGWWYVTGGKVDFSFNGIASNTYGFWYITGGKVDFSYNGTCVYNGTKYTIVGGKVQN